MKRQLILLALFIAMMFGTSCSSENLKPGPELTYGDFEDNLKSSMTYDAIIAKFDEPSADIGSGIHIYVYELVDSSEMWIGYTDKILYAKRMDKNHQLMETLI